MHSLHNTYTIHFCAAYQITFPDALNIAQNGTCLSFGTINEHNFCTMFENHSKLRKFKKEVFEKLAK